MDKDGFVEDAAMDKDSFVEFVQPTFVEGKQKAARW